MSFDNKGSMATTVTVSLEPDRSGNYICDGTADDVQIQAAIDHVNGIGGGLVVVKNNDEGTPYDITATVDITERVHLYGNGFPTLRPASNINVVEIVGKYAFFEKFEIKTDDVTDWASAALYVDGVNLFGQGETNKHITGARDIYLLGGRGQGQGTGILLYLDGDNEYIAFLLFDHFHIERFDKAIWLNCQGGSDGNFSWINENDFHNIKAFGAYESVVMERDTAELQVASSIQGNEVEIRASFAGGAYTSLNGYRLEGRDNYIISKSVDIEDLSGYCVHFEEDAEWNTVLVRRGNIQDHDILDEGINNDVIGYGYAADNHRFPMTWRSEDRAEAGNAVTSSKKSLWGVERWDGARHVINVQMAFGAIDQAADDAQMQLYPMRVLESAGVVTHYWRILLNSVPYLIPLHALS